MTEVAFASLSCEHVFECRAWYRGQSSTTSCTRGSGTNGTRSVPSTKNGQQLKIKTSCNFAPADKTSPKSPEVLLEGLEDALEVEVVGQPLHGRDTLAPAALLHADMDLGLVASLLLRVGERIWTVTNGHDEAAISGATSYSLSRDNDNGQALRR